MTASAPCIFIIRMQSGTFEQEGDFYPHVRHEGQVLSMLGLLLLLLGQVGHLSNIGQMY